MRESGREREGERHAHTVRCGNEGDREIETEREREREREWHRERSRHDAAFSTCLFTFFPRFQFDHPSSVDIVK